MELSAELSKSENCLSAKRKSIDHVDNAREELTPPPVPPLPVNYQRSDGKKSIFFRSNLKLTFDFTLLLFDLLLNIPFFDFFSF